ncbi:MAG: hypothetical protein RLY76_1221, partial [Actinomycetota bacterium]
EATQAHGEEEAQEASKEDSHSAP